MTSPVTSAAQQQPEGRFDRFINRFKLNSHFEMERFRIFVITFTVLGALLFTLTAFSAYRSSQADISDKALYTTSFSTSRTQQMGKVTGIYTNTAKTRAVVLYYFEDATVSLNPNDYEAIIMGVDGNKVKKVDSAMTAQIAGFGKTKYMALVLDAPGGFKPQILNATMTSKKELVSPNPMSDEALAERGYLGEAFRTKDMWRMMFNPAGNNATVLPELDDADFNTRSFLSNTVFRTQEQDIRRKLDTSLVDMHTQQERIGTYYDMIENISVDIDGEMGVTLVPPLPPEQIAGDKVDGMSSAQLASAIDESYVTGEDVPDLAKKSDEAREVDTYADGYMPTTYKLETSTAIAGGVDYNWRDSTIDAGYANDLVPAGRQLKEYVASLTAAGKNYDGPNFNNSKFMLSNGKSLESYIRGSDSTHGDDAALLNLNSTAGNLVQSYRSFYDAKRRYQTIELVNLLKLELELDDAENASSFNNNSDAVSVNR